MELRHLRYFQAVAEELSFSRAASVCMWRNRPEPCHQATGTALGAEVLERTRHHVRLTPAGAVLLSEVASLLQQLEELTHRVRRTAAARKGNFASATSVRPRNHFWPPSLRHRKCYPLVSIHLEERTPERVWKWWQGPLVRRADSPGVCPRSTRLAHHRAAGRKARIVVPPGIRWPTAAPCRGPRSRANAHRAGAPEGMGCTMRSLPVPPAA